MDIRFLSTFLEVAHTRHFGKAADNLYLTQSAVSARIKLLEEYFNTTLFVRNRNSIQLSPAGEKLVPFAESLSATLADARKALNEEGIQHLVCAATPNAFEVHLSKALSSIVQQFPALTVRTDLASLEYLSRQLHERSVDLAFSLEPLKSDDIESTKLTEMPLCFFADEKRKNTNTLEQLVLIEWSQKITEKLLARYPEVKHAKIRTSSCQVAIQYVSNNGGSLLLPADQSNNLLHKMNVPCELHVEVYMSYLKTHGHAGLADIVQFLQSI